MSDECSKEHLSDGDDKNAIMANNVSFNGSVSHWIVDSGATNHMAGGRRCF